MFDPFTVKKINIASLTPVPQKPLMATVTKIAMMMMVVVVVVAVGSMMKTV